MVFTAHRPEPVGLHVRACPDWPSLCKRVSAHLATFRDPFDQPVLIVPGAAQRRSLRQWIAAGGPAPSAADEGVCAGVEMIGMAQLRARLEAEVLGVEAGDDPWSGPGLGAHLAAVMEQARGAAWFAAVQRHLDGHAQPPRQRPGRLVATARSIGRLLGDYARHCPQMLLSWESGDPVDAAGRPLDPSDRWQAELFTLLVARLDEWPQPARRAQLLGRRIRGGQADASLPHSLGVLGDKAMPSADIDLLDAISTRQVVPVWQLGRPAPAVRHCTLARLYGRLRDEAWQQWAARAETTDPPALPTGDEPTSLLGLLQRDVRDDRAVTGGRTPDGTIQFHLSHGPDRQVEVLREMLCELFDTDPGLQPRDVVVACTDLARYAPLLEADLAADPQPGMHPGHGLRVRLTTSHDESNPVRELLLDLLSLPERRATATELTAIAGSPVVARRFGLDAEALATVPELLARAQVRWGIDGAQRSRAGLPAVRQGTWISGLDRLLAGLVLADSPLARIDTVVPVDHIDASDAETIGALAELVSRIRMHLMRCATPAGIPQWCRRLAEAMADLAEPDAADQWQVNQVSTRLAELARTCPQSTPVLDRAEFAELLGGRLPWRHRPAVFGSGDLAVCGLDELGQLSYRMVCLLGVDDAHMPPRSTMSGDDLLTRPEVTSTRPQTAALARQDLLDAILCARERVLIVGAGGDPFSGEPLPESVVVADLLEATGATSGTRCWPGPTGSSGPEGRCELVHWHSLQPHSPRNFTGDERGLPFSFDEQALAGAKALADAPAHTAPQPVWEIRAPDVPEPDEPTELEELVRFYQDPAAAWFRHTFGFLPADPAEPLPVDLPIELDGLEQYSLGTSMLESLLAGETIQSVCADALLSGAAPPGPIGQQTLGAILPALQSMTATIDGLRGDRFDIDLGVRGNDAPVSGLLTGFGDALVEHRFGRVRAKDLIGAWVRLLCASACTPRIRRAVLVGREQMHTLAAPEPESAARVVGQVVALRTAGLGSFVPLPPQAALRQARAWVEGDRREWEISREFDRETRFSVLWSDHLQLGWDELSRLPPHSEDPLDETPSRFANLSRWLYAPLVQHWQSTPLMAAIAGD